MIHIKIDLEAVRPRAAPAARPGGRGTSNLSRVPPASRWRRWAMASVLAAAGLGASAQPMPVAGQPQQLPTVSLTAGFHRITAMVASTPAQRSHGLMWRREMGANDGMLFVFEQPSPQCFWMKNTLIPLAIAFLDDEGTIVNIEEMKAQTTDSHCSAKPVRYALEMNAGWFSKKGLRAGDRLTGGPWRSAR